MAEYEELRKRKLEENRKKIEELKLSHLSLSFLQSQSPAKPSTPSPSKKKRLGPKEKRLVVLRRSRRVANLPQQANYTEESPRHVFVARRRVARLSFSSPGGKKRDLSGRVYASYEAREYATQKAEDLMETLGAEFPSFVKPMLQSHVTGGFWLGLPKYFCTNHLPTNDTIMTLIDESGNCFETNYLARKNGLSGGWMRFAVDHELVDGDALVFHLVSRTTFKVYIVRAAHYGGR